MSDWVPCRCEHCASEGYVDQDASCLYFPQEREEQPTWSKTCRCGSTVERWRGQGDVSCYSNCGATYNASGQLLRDDWRGNRAWADDDIDDMEGYEMQQLARETHD